MKVSVFTEFEKLKSVVVADVVTYFDHEAINDNQALYYKISPPNKELMMQQQKMFFNELIKNDVDLVFSERLDDCPDQINTRDPSFVIGNTFFVSSMKESLRREEKKGLSKIISTLESRVVYLDDCTIEGGDVLLCRDVVFVGVSRRTTTEGIEMLRKYVDGVRLVPVYLKPGFLHLDTVFNIISDDIALVCSEAVQEESLATIKKKFNTIDITLDEQLHLGTNVLSLAPKRIVSQTYNKRINEELYKIGCDVIQVDYSEITKLGGAFRCGTCPLARE